MFQEARSHLKFLPDELVDRIHAECELNDRAHQPDHVFGVVLMVDKILKIFPECNHYRKVLMAAALLHDVKCHLNRDIHHVLAAQCVDHYYGGLGIFDEHELTLIRLCILEHRASFKGVRTGDVTEIMAAADRGEPRVPQYLKRAVLYRISQDGTTPENVTADIRHRHVYDAVQHLTEKFGILGYAWKTTSKFVINAYGPQIVDFQNELHKNRAAVLMYGITNYEKWLAGN